MITKKILSVLFAAFVVIATLSLVSAATFSVSGLTFTKSSNSTTFTIPTTSNETVTVPSTATVTIGSTVVGFAFTPNGALGINTSAIRTITATHNLTAAEVASLKLGSFANTFLVYNSTDNATGTITFNSAFCDAGSSTNATRYLEITSVKDVSSENDFEWKPADEVELTVKVEFTNDLDNDDEIDAIIEMSLYDSVSKTFVDLDNEDDFEREVSLAEGDSVTETFTLNVPVEDMVDGTGRYKLYVKVYEDGKESTLCKDNYDSVYYKDVEIQRNSYEVVLQDWPTTIEAKCGDDVTINFNAINIGTNDEDQVYARAVVGLLGVDANSSVFALDEADSRTGTVTFTVPKTASDKAYDLYLSAYYKYSDSSDSYREYTEDAYKITLNLIGCADLTKNASITATLSEDTPRAIIGRQTVIETTVTNTGNAPTIYSVEVSGNSAWSKATVDPVNSFTLNAGESKAVKVYLDIAEDGTAGDKEFTISANYGAGSIEKKVKLTVEDGFTSQALVDHFKSYWYIYAIVLVTLILIIAIIIVARSLVKKD